MTSVINSVTSWLGGSRETDSGEEGEKNNSPVPPTDGTTRVGTSGATAQPGVDNVDEERKQSTKDLSSALPLDVDLQEVSEKAIQAAKEWGNYLFNVGKTASEQVAKTAKQLKDTVEEKTIIGDFAREQGKFVAEHSEKKKLSEAAVPPWVGYNEEEVMKTQILALSKDKRNFLRNPPAGVQFQFDYEASFPIAMVMLEEDEELKAMRFKIVPREIKEEVFWRNYFYRVSLIKQSTQLTSLAQHNVKHDATRQSATKSDSNTSVPAEGSEADELTVGSPPAEHEFVSDSFQADSINADELQQEMYQLGVSDDNTPLNELPEWERELQAELQEYEVVDDGNNIDDADLEREIMKQIEAESKQI